MAAAFSGSIASNGTCDATNDGADWSRYTAYCRSGNSPGSLFRDWRNLNVLTRLRRFVFFLI